LRFLDQIGLESIHERVEALGSTLLDTLGSLRHANGNPAATIYGPRDFDRRGATVAFNFLHPDGHVVDERYVDRVARRHKISLRTGCFCNPGAGEVAFTIARETLVGGEFSDGMTLDDYIEAIGLPSAGAVRASLGPPSNAADIARFAAFAHEFVDIAAIADDLPPRAGC
jgi:selenocysteine lyase/cysteine desulfurase